MKLDKQYVKWWLRYRLLSPSYLWDDIKWWFLHRTFRRFNVVKLKSLKPGYYDADHRMLYACFNLLVDFVEKERGVDDISELEADLNSGRNMDKLERSMLEDQFKAHIEMMNLYAWWIWTYLKRPDLVDVSFKQEDEYLKEEDAQLIRLIKVRNWLWS